MQRTKYALEFKDEAVKQVIDKGHTVVDVAKRLGIPDNVLYTWVSKFKKADQPESSDLKAMQAEVAKLKAELRQIKKRIYNTRDEAGSEVFDYIEGFYNRVLRHKHLDQLSPHEFERQRQTAL